MAEKIHPLRQNARPLFAALTGTAVEFYDFYVFATATALVFGALFFPKSSPEAQGIQAFMVFGIAFLARPIGAVAFGHFGDRVGRKATLVASLLLMGASTRLVAFLPGYASAGFAAPVLLCLLRFGQGFGLGGEWGGAALLAVENAPRGWETRFGAAPQLGAPVGFILANGLFLLLGTCLNPDEFQRWGWRIPFLLSALLVIVGLWVRLRIGETPAFARMLEEERPPAVPLREAFARHTPEIVCGTFAAVSCFAFFYLATAFALGYGTTTRGISRETFLSIQLVAILFLAAGILTSGYGSDRRSPRFVLAVGCILGVPLGFALAPMLGGGVAAIFAFLAMALFVMGLLYGPLGAWLPSLFPARVRYTGVSIAFNMGGIFGGALTPFAAQALAERGGLAWVGGYLSLAALVSLVALALLPKGVEARAGIEPACKDLQSSA